VHVDWVSPEPQAAGNTFGYAVAIREMKRAAQQAGLQLVPGAPVAFHFATPLGFTPDPTRKNVLFSMFESYMMPPALAERLAGVDLLLVPSTFAGEVMAPYVRCPIRVVPLGVDTSVFTSVRRRWWPGRPFVMLHVGAPNARKGVDVIEACWQEFFAHRPECRLYLKTTGNAAEAEAEARRCGWVPTPYPGLVTHGNITLDLRTLPIAALVALYHQAHCFLFPTAGEGVGLSLLESLATGLPSVATRYSGLLDYTTEATVTYLPWTFRPAWAVDSEDAAPVVTDSAWVEPRDLAAAIDAVMQDYDAAVRQGRRAAQHMRNNFSWDRAGRALVRALAA
jgi:glycosyltransferase involved in cell wall biosynthesis